MPERRTLAAVDLGSNSFHMLVARLEHGQVRVIDRIREMVRLAAGLNEQGELDPAVETMALECLARFGDRLREVPRENIRAVGTQTFRRLNHPGSFLRAAEQALMCPVEIIGGREEARLIYTGVHSTMPPDDEHRLVIDIGGGSTELIIGLNEQPLLTESLQYGCVTVTQKFFPEQQITQKSWKKARSALLGDLQELVANFKTSGWSKAIGTSGTLRAISSVCRKAGWLDSGITRTALNQLIALLIQHGRTDKLKLPGLSERRAPVFAGGVLVLDALCEALGIEQLSVSQSALREGLLYDMLGRLAHTDPRDATTKAMARRYELDQQQASRVRHTALKLFDQIASTWDLNDNQRDLLAWTADLHEMGLAISHSRYQDHSAYLLRHSDMAGFSRLEQRIMAFLAAHQRRPISAEWHEDVPRRLHQTAARMLVILRLSIILHRSRSQQELPQVRLSLTPPGSESKADTQAVKNKGKTLYLVMDLNWIKGRPLIAQDLRQERQLIKPLGIQLKILDSCPS